MDPFAQNEELMSFPYNMMRWCVYCITLFNSNTHRVLCIVCVLNMYTGIYTLYRALNINKIQESLDGSI